jgi:hypothetical protein
MVGLLGRVIIPSQGLYLHRTTQHRKTRTNIHALSGIRTHDPSNQPTKTDASDSTATVTGKEQCSSSNNNMVSETGNQLLFIFADRNDIILSDVGIIMNT